MGSYYGMGMFSNIPICYSDEVAIVFLVRLKYPRIEGEYKICFPTIFAKYEDCNQFYDVVTGPHTEWLLKYFKFDGNITDLLANIDDVMVGRWGGETCCGKNETIFKTLKFGIEHKKIYDEIVTFAESKFTQERLNKLPFEYYPYPYEYKTPEKRFYFQNPEFYPFLKHKNYKSKNDFENAVGVEKIHNAMYFQLGMEVLNVDLKPFRYGGQEGKIEIYKKLNQHINEILNSEQSSDLE